jgi:anti-sigma B factor antagonist
MSSHLRLDTRRIRTDAIVSVRGDVDLTTSDAVESALDAARVGATALVLDLREAGFMDTSGLRLVISEQQRARSDGYRFVVVPGSGRSQRLFEIAEFPGGHPLFADPPTEPVGG